MGNNWMLGQIITRMKSGWTYRIEYDVGKNVEEGPDDVDDQNHDMVKELYTPQQQDGGYGGESIFVSLVQRLFKIFIYPTTKKTF